MIIELKQDSELYERIDYPAGEMQVRLRPTTAAILDREFTGRKGNLTVVARIRSASDIVETSLLLDACNKIMPCQHATLILPYLPYARADRRFVTGDCHGLGVFGRLAKSFACQRIITIDPHSDAAMVEMKHLEVVNAETWIRKSIDAFRLETDSEDSTITVLFPDAGARRRYGDIECFVSDNMIRVNNCEKQRDAETGRLSGFDVPHVSGPTLIIDDICDGGGTFLGIAENISASVPLGLYVTHGIFSKGTKLLTDRFRRVYCTDSYSKLPIETGAIQWDAVRHLGESSNDR